MAIGFQSLQTVQKYEEALARHGQYVRWTRAVTCPCMNPFTGQANLNCSLCKGRGRIYKNPLPMQVRQEIVNHDSYGRMYLKNMPFNVDSVRISRKQSYLSRSLSQPPDGDYFRIDPPYPKSHEVVYADYEFTNSHNIYDENSSVAGTNVLQCISLKTTHNGKTYTGSISSVSRVANMTKGKLYTVSKFEKDFIFLTGMQDWTSGDVLEVDYTYIEPFNFIISGVSPKIRYEKPYVLDEAQALLVTPYYCVVGSNDLITTLAAEKRGEAIVNPSHSAGNDEIKNYWDIYKILSIIDADGIEYPIDSSVRLFGRNEISWSVAKPEVNYTVQFLYNPTYIALRDSSSIRRAENKEFVNKMNLIMYDKLGEETF